MKRMNLQNRNTDLREGAYGLPVGRMRGRDSSGVWDGHVYTAMFKMDNQQGPTYCIEHGTLLNVTWRPGREGGLGEKGYM